MSKNNVIDLERRDENEDPLTDSLRAGAQPLIHQAVEAALPWLYLKGISTGEMNSALEVLVGPQAKGLLQFPGETLAEHPHQQLH